MENFWSTCLSRFEQELSTQQFNTWIKPLFVEIEGNTIRLIAPNRFVMQWVKAVSYTHLPPSTIPVLLGRKRKIR